jgi:hypothetical protein
MTKEDEEKEEKLWKKVEGRKTYSSCDIRGSQRIGDGTLCGLTGRNRRFGGT